MKTCKKNWMLIEKTERKKIQHQIIIHAFCDHLIDKDEQKGKASYLRHPHSTHTVFPNGYWT